MKTISLWIITLSFPIFLISCSTDELTEITETNLFDNGAVSKRDLLAPENNYNKYDTIGSMQNRILAIYLSENHNHTTVGDINDEIQHLIYGSGTIGSNGIFPTTSPVEQIIDIINSPESSLGRIISGSYLSNSAKTSLTDFIDSLLLLKEEDYIDIYEFIVLYEASVIENTLFNSEDKRVILTTSAIARYSFYFERDRKDKDWETSVGNLAASVEGALDNSLTAVNMTLVTGISLSKPL